MKRDTLIWTATYVAIGLFLAVVLLCLKYFPYYVIGAIPVMIIVGFVMGRRHDGTKKRVQGLMIYADGTEAYHENGKLRCAQLVGNQIVQEIPVGECVAEFYPSGRLLSAALSHNHRFGTISLTAGYEVGLFEDGRLGWAMCCGNPADLPNAEVKQITIALFNQNACVSKILFLEPVEGEVQGLKYRHPPTKERYNAVTLDAFNQVLACEYVDDGVTKEADRWLKTGTTQEISS